MAYIGLRYVVAAPLSAHTAGADPTYGTGMVIGKGIQANLTINRNNNPLYADDAIAEDDNGITSMSLQLGLDDLLEDAQVLLLGTTKVTGTSNNPDVYYDGEASAPAVGVGYIRVRRKNGTTKYQAVWMYKGVYGEDGENTETKGESINWQTPTVTGRCAALSVDATGVNKFRKRAVFDTEAAAKAWLNALAGIS